MSELAAARWGRWTWRLVAAVVLFGPGAVSAQSLTPGKPGPYVIDLRAAMSGLPKSSAFHPVIPESTLVPSRGFGLDVGGQIFVGSIGPARLGFGANVVRARGTATTPAPASSGATPPPTSGGTLSLLSASDPIRVAITLTAVTPQISFNFGTSDGWSYLSGGYGAAWINTTAEGTSAFLPAGPLTLSTKEGASRAANYGGGARWFIRPHLAVGFDVRFLRVRSSGLRPATTEVLASAGVSLR